MNILVPFKWLTEITKTDLNAEKVAELLTLRSSSVEKITQVEGDDVYEIEITPNRGDALSVVGIARELHAILQAEGQSSVFSDPLKDIYEPTNFSNNKQLKIEILDKKLAPRFTAVVIGNVKITESSEIMKKRLTQVGIRPINNIVDVTNYVMFETGQPMHAFDYDKIKGNLMRLRASKPKEEIVTLDGVSRPLPENSIVIEDAEKIIDLCGIMGGQNSEISLETKNVVMFSQIYDPVCIRKTSLLLNHRTEAALRFEKSIDPQMQKLALLRSLKLLKETCEFSIESELYDVDSTDKVEKSVTLSYDKLNLYADTELDKNMVENILNALAFSTMEKNESSITVKVPGFRNNDVSIEEDLIEEVVRIYGYEKIGLKLPHNFYFDESQNIESLIERKIKYYLRDTGFSELITFTMVPEEEVDLEKAVKISNPLNENMQFMRTSLEKSLENALTQNVSEKELRVFEIGNTYKLNSGDLPIETYKLSLLHRGEDSVQVIKNSFINIFKILNISNYSFSYQDQGMILIKIDDEQVGEIRVRENYTYGKIWLEKVMPYVKDVPQINFASKFAIISEDLTVHFPIETYVQDVLESLKKLDERILEVNYKNEFFKTNKRAVSVSFKYQDAAKNITNEDATEIRNKIIKHLENDLKLFVDRPQ